MLLLYAYKNVGFAVLIALSLIIGGATIVVSSHLLAYFDISNTTTANDNNATDALYSGNGDGCTSSCGSSQVGQNNIQTTSTTTSLREQVVIGWLLIFATMTGWLGTSFLLAVVDAYLWIDNQEQIKIQGAKSRILFQKNHVLTPIALGVVNIIVMSWITLLPILSFYPTLRLSDSSTLELSDLLRVGFSFIILDGYTFTIHYLCHKNVWLYKNVHKMHHYYTAPVAVTSMYLHPIEWTMLQIPAAMGGPWLTDMKLAPLMLWLTYLQVALAASHSGYTFMLGGDHDRHHEKFTVNYSVFGLFDRMFGTYVPEDDPFEAYEEEFLQIATWYYVKYLDPLLSSSSLQVHNGSFMTLTDHPRDVSTTTVGVSLKRSISEPKAARVPYVWLEDSPSDEQPRAPDFSMTRLISDISAVEEDTPRVLTMLDKKQLNREVDDVWCRRRGKPASILPGLNLSSQDENDIFQNPHNMMRNSLICTDDSKRSINAKNEQ